MSTEQPSPQEFPAVADHYAPDYANMTSPTAPPIMTPPTTPAPTTNHWFAARRNFSVTGWALCAMVLVWIGLNILFTALCQLLLGSDLPQWLINALSSVPLYCAAMPLAIYVMHTIRPIPTTTFPMSGRSWASALLVCIGIMLVGNIIGNVLALGLSGGKAINPIEELNTRNLWVNLIFTAIGPAFFEEWLFRKQLISRLRQYGERVAIVYSAAAFALFHLNLFQMFYAFGIGMVLGYVYMRTSQLRYTIALHMALNFLGGVVPFSLTDMRALTVYALCEFAAGIVGIVLLVWHCQHLEFYTTPRELPVGSRWKTTLLTPGSIVYAAVAVAIIIAIMLLQMQ